MVAITPATKPTPIPSQSGIYSPASRPAPGVLILLDVLSVPMAVGSLEVLPVKVCDARGVVNVRFVSLVCLLGRRIAIAGARSEADADFAAAHKYRV